MASSLIRSKAPLRISFAGGGTDVAPYPEMKGGVVLNCTIDKYCYATLVPKGNGGPTTVHSLDFNMSLDYGKAVDLTYTGELDLVKAALKVLETKEETKGKLGGLELFLHSDAPPGTGLGSSSTMMVAIVSAFRRHFSLPWTQYEIAEMAFHMEREELGKKGGRQDQYAATFGGFNFMEFGARNTIVNPLRIPPDTMNELQYRLLLCYTGTGHYSDDIVKSQQDNMQKGRPDTVSSLDATKRLTIEMKNSLLRGNIDDMGNLLDELWQLKKKFTDDISNPLIDKLYEKARKAGALGGKLVGAGGGGYLLLFTDFARRKDVAAVIEEGGGRTTPFNFEPNGVQTWQVSS